MRLTARAIVPAIIALVTAAAIQTAARADYIWATIEGDQVRFALMENANSTPNPQYDSYVTDLTPRNGQGKALTSGAPKAGASYTTLPAGQPTGKGVATAEKIVGIRERGGETYLLVYHAKGAASLPAAGTLTKAPAEVLARKEGDKLIVSVRQAGKPVPQSEVWVEWPGEETSVTTNLKTDDKGEVAVAWPSAPHSGFISIRAKVNEAKAGELEGKPYPAIRRWATLTFPVEGPKQRQSR